MEPAHRFIPTPELDRKTGFLGSCKYSESHGKQVSVLTPDQDDTLAKPPNAPGRMIDPTGGTVGPLGSRGD